MAEGVEAKLSDLGLSLPEPVKPVASYVPSVATGGLLFVSGQLPFQEGGPMKGQLSAVSGEAEKHAAAKAAQLCGLHLLAQVKAALGTLDRVTRVVKLTGFVNSTGDFTGQPAIVNGCSDLMVAVFDEAGQHSRSAVGVAALPLGAVVEVEGIFEVS
ncbi:MAG: RidA family protein [Pseudomonadota bacterium]